MEDGKLFFRKHLLEWFARNHRPLPWKGERDPYRIWLSEVILQQTRVEQGLPYYQKFVERYPTVRQLADAPEDEVLKLWEGLGYYSRARNLHAAARSVARDSGGIFPDTYAGIRALKGVGDYTAAAIASFAFGLPYAVLDGNVYRVLARYFGIATPTDTPAAKKQFASLAQELLDPSRPGDFNQAIMDFGATHCTPQQPKCGSCPLRPHCVAFQSGRIAELPVKSKSAGKKNRYFIYLVARFQGDTFVRKRGEKDIWQDLYEFPLLEVPEFPADRRQLERVIGQQMFEDGEGRKAGEITAVSLPYRQVLTHRVVTAIFCEMTFAGYSSPLIFENPPFQNCRRISPEDLKKNIAVPRIIDRYLKEKALTLTLF